MKSVTPEALLQLADALVQDLGAPRRAAISRAYYAAFHALQDVVPCEGVPGPNGCYKHADVIRGLRDWRSKHEDRRLAMQFGAEATRQLHYFMSCKDGRERADYMMAPEGEELPGEALALIAKARRIVTFASKVRDRMSSARAG